MGKQQKKTKKTKKTGYYDDSDLPLSNSDPQEFAPRWKDVRHLDIRLASWKIAELIDGPDDGTMERDGLECQIQHVIAETFDKVCGTKSVAEMRARGW